MHFYSEWARHILEGHSSDGFAFYGLPGYAWILALLYKLAGFNPLTPALFQAGLDAGTAVIIYKISIRVFAGASQFAGLIGMLAALGWTFFVPAQTYAAILMPTTAAVFVFWFVVWQIVRQSGPPRKLAALTLGLIIGLSATAVATILFLLPLVAAAYWSRSVRVARLGLLSLLTLGVVAGTSPCWIHNYFIAHDPVLLSAHSGINFWIGNNPEANGYPRFPPGLRAGQTAMLQDSIAAAESAAGHALKRAEVSRYWSAQARAYIVQQPLAWLKLLALKCRNLISAFQYDDLSVITSLREEGVTFPGVYFGLTAALALPGIILAWKTTPLSRWISVALLFHSLALLPVFVTERYRLPIVPGLLLFAAFGLVSCWQYLSSLNIAPALSYSCLLLVSSLFVAWPQRDKSLWALDAYNSGCQALATANLQRAEQKLQLAYAYVPTNPETNFALGNLRLAQGEAEAASEFYHITLQYDEHHRGALNNLGVIALDSGRPSLAEQCFRRALALDQRNAKCHFLLAKTLLAQGRAVPARVEIGRAVSLEPDRAEFRDLQHRMAQ